MRGRLRISYFDSKATLRWGIRPSDVTECWLGSLRLDVGNFITFGRFAISSAMNWPNGLASTPSVIPELANPDSSCRCRVSETASQIMIQIKDIDGRASPAINR